MGGGHLARNTAIPQGPAGYTLGQASTHSSDLQNPATSVLPELLTFGILAAISGSQGTGFPILVRRL